MGVLAPTAATATAAPVAPAVSCSSQRAGLAAQLTKDITAALKGRSGTVAVVVNDRISKTSCSLRADQQFDSASVVKATVLGTLLWDAAKTGRQLTATERSRATAMITQSDNNATSALWKQLGVAKVKGFLTAAGMTRTVPGADGYWGLTQITARDQQKLLALLTVRNNVLTDASRSYALQLMNQVVPSQRWGTPAGAPATATVHLKNGWLSRASYGWRVHSIGAFTGKGHDYQLTVLTHGNKTMDDGINTIQAVARAVHKDLNPKAKLSRTVKPPVAPQEALPAVPEAPARTLITATPQVQP
ncbi:class A beta-lactamase-related serine hydrolase [Streptomyces sp. LP05-1]|uniref:Class A beta-lactamase-related serine hydrolase n=1 Tax=Streptomyces pyxinae TaxID=2970734 RepID=A0ABT2CK52_9ACTN|nr:class A beta-lactamase-related serine hydrolase [Streptomyces sp. LP05-1]MCS0637796.1 class A beta-lactamase-related serine hydrolase [Streptomyces sp. LP05-1]